MVNTDDLTTGVIPSASFPAIIIGGAPNAGKSVLTYTLTRELRRLEIPHFVFRASTDGEGDWFLRGDLDTVREIRKQNKGKWSDRFRKLVSQDLAHRQLPLIVDLGGIPRDEDTCIFEVCTHAILLLKDDERDATETWHRFIIDNRLGLIAELRSQLGGKSAITANEKILTGTITDLLRVERIPERRGDPVFDALIGRIIDLFRTYTPEQIETFHINSASVKPVVNLKRELYDLDPSSDEWSADLLQPLLEKLSPYTAMAAYGRAPNWVYTALAMHAYPQPFHQFDACLGWVQPQPLQVSQQPSGEIIGIDYKTSGDAYIVRVRPTHYYLDYTEAEQLAFPEPPANMGVIVSGKIPFWLFTSLARFYADRNVPWIAVNYVFNSRPVVVYSRVASHPIGKTLPKLT